MQIKQQQVLTVSMQTGQSGKVKTKNTKPAKKPTKAELELEHANKLSTGDDSVQGNMKNMKAQGKCNTGK